MFKENRITSYASEEMPEPTRSLPQGFHQESPQEPPRTLTVPSKPGTSPESHESIQKRKNLSKITTPEAKNKAPEVIKPSQIALIGDSIGLGIETILNELDPARHDIIDVKNGTTAVKDVRTDAGENNIRSQIDKIDPTKTPYLIIEGGTNDLGYTYQNPDPRTVARKLADIYRLALNKTPPFKKVMLVTIPPQKNMPAYINSKGEHHIAVDWETRGKICNKELRKIAAAEGINLFDLYKECKNRETAKDPKKRYVLRKDGVHPKLEAYQMMTELLVTEISKQKYNTQKPKKKIPRKK